MTFRFLTAFKCVHFKDKVLNFVYVVTVRKSIYFSLFSDFQSGWLLSVVTDDNGTALHSAHFL